MKTLSRTVLTLFVLSFSCLAAIAGEVSFKITKQYLNFPISHKENRGRMTFEVNGKPDLSVVIRLAPDEAEYWVFKDVSAFKGKTIKITYDGNEKGLSKIYQSDEIEGQAELYKEKNRPQFKLGGALRFNYNFSDWNSGHRDRGGDLGYDVFMLRPTASYKGFLLDADCRFYSAAFGGFMLKYGCISYDIM